MKAHRAEHTISTMARVLELSRSGYYAWLARSPSERSKHEVQLMAAIASQHRQSRGIYGAPRIHAALREAGARVGKSASRG
jgi:putative transposase